MSFFIDHYIVFANVRLFTVGADINSTVVSSALGSVCSVIHSAVRGGRTDSLRLLLNHEGNALAEGVVAKESLFGTPLDFARQRGERECAAMLERHCSERASEIITCVKL